MAVGALPMWQVGRPSTGSGPVPPLVYKGIFHASLASDRETDACRGVCIGCSDGRSPVSLPIIIRIACGRVGQVGRVGDIIRPIANKALRSLMDHVRGRFGGSRNRHAHWRHRDSFSPSLRLILGRPRPPSIHPSAVVNPSVGDQELSSFPPISQSDGRTRRWRVLRGSGGCAR